MESAGLVFADDAIFASVRRKSHRRGAGRTGMAGARGWRRSLGLLLMVVIEKRPMLDRSGLLTEEELLRQHAVRARNRWIRTERRRHERRVVLQRRQRRSHSRSDRRQAHIAQRVRRQAHLSRSERRHAKRIKRRRRHQKWIGTVVGRRRLAEDVVHEERAAARNGGSRGLLDRQ